MAVTQAAPRFFCDAMLGRLARWLRALGFDAAYEDGIHDDDLVARAREEGRRILTRDRRLAQRLAGDEVVVVSIDNPRAQLAQVLERLELALPEHLFTRCTLCNEPLETLAADEARRSVPEGVRAHHARFTRCPRCRRIYWEGGHVRRMRARLEEVLGEGR